MATMAKTSLKTYRTQAHASQEDVARRADITLATFRNAESGRNITYSTATAILTALNAIRKERGLAAVSLSELNLSIV